MNALARRLSSLLLAVASAALLHAEIRLMPEHISVEPVSEIQIQILETNDGTAELACEFPGRVRGVLHGGSDHSEPVWLVRSEGALAVRIAPGGFVRAGYSLRVPSGYLGPVVLEVPSLSEQPVMFSVQAARPAGLASAPASESRPAGNAAGEREAAMRRATRVLAGVSAYDPVYFIMGAGGGLNAKFQFSLKYNPLDMQPVYMGFTQTSIWDLHGDSKPFHDSAYRPALFYLKENLLAFEGLGAEGKQSVVLGLQGGFEHESNGRGGSDSRSINIAFFRPRLTWNISERMRLVVSPKVYGYIEKSENPDIAEYRGYADLYAAFHYGDWKFSTTLRKGTRGNFGSVQLDALIPLHITDELFDHIGVHGVNGYWLLQYFNGWGETILDYKSKGPAQFRVGLLVVP